MQDIIGRRCFLIASGVASTSLVARPGVANAARARQGSAKSGDAGKEPEVTAVEDLMREHGVIRRALAVYREAGARLRNGSGAVPPDALAKTAKLLRRFAEDYHEKKLEEAHIFPAVKRASGAAGQDIEHDIDTLIAQHQRGREITDFVVSMSNGTIAASRSAQLASAMETFARMYEEHAAREDTVIFPAWKRAVSAKQLDEMGELFEDIEHKTFGKDGFDDAVEQIAAVERSFGLDLAQFTAPKPPNP